MSLMPKIARKQKSELGIMEYFILALIGRTGLSTLYDFQQKAALQPGAARSAMQRLERMNLISRAESSSRRRRELALSEEGYDVLYKSWRECMKNYLDTESLIRAAWLALVMNEPMFAAEYLEGNARIRSFMEEEKRMKAEQLAKTQKYLSHSFI